MGLCDRAPPGRSRSPKVEFEVKSQIERQHGGLTLRCWGQSSERGAWDGGSRLGAHRNSEEDPADQPQPQTAAPCHGPTWSQVASVGRGLSSSAPFEHEGPGERRGTMNPGCLG